MGASRHSAHRGEEDGLCVSPSCIVAPWRPALPHLQEPLHPRPKVGTMGLVTGVVCASTGRAGGAHPTSYRVVGSVGVGK